MTSRSTPPFNTYSGYTVTDLTSDTNYATYFPYPQPSPGHPNGGAGSGKTLRLGSGNDVVFGELAQLKDTVIDGGGGNNIFLVTNTPDVITSSATSTFGDFPYTTINSTSLLNSSLKNFSEVDFSVGDGLNNGNAPTYYGLRDGQISTIIDTQKLNVNKIGIVEDSGRFLESWSLLTNLASTKTVIAKQGMNGDGFMVMGLQALQANSATLNPFFSTHDNTTTAFTHAAQGAYKTNGDVHLQLDPNSEVLLLPDTGLNTDGYSNFKHLYLTGSGQCFFVNSLQDNPTITNITVDASAMTGSLIMSGSPGVSETITLPLHPPSVDLHPPGANQDVLFLPPVQLISLAGSTLASLDTVINAGNTTIIDPSGFFFADETTDTTFEHISPTGKSWQDQMAFAEAASIHDQKVVWFVYNGGAGPATYIIDRYSDDQAVSTAHVPSADGRDFAIKLVGAHTLSVDGGVDGFASLT